MVHQSFFRRHWIVIVAGLIGMEVSSRVDGPLGGSMGNLVRIFVVLAGFYICTAAIGLLLMKITTYLHWGECYLSADDHEMKTDA